MHEYRQALMRMRQGDSEREIARSNFYGMMNIDYEQVGIFGTGMIMADEGKKTALNFRQFKPWFLAIEEDDEGVVDTVRRGGDTDTNAAIAGALLGAFGWI